MCYLRKSGSPRALAVGISHDAYQEYSDRVMCRQHWNFMWKGRRATKQDDGCSVVRSRPEEFGGIVQTKNGQVLMLDHEAFKKFVTGKIVLGQDTSGVFYSEVGDCSG